MRKKVFGRKFKRDKNERQALFKNLISQLVENERIETTLQKAKAIQPQAEKLVTKVKKREANSALTLQKYLKGDLITKMIEDIGPRFQNRNGGYLRIIKTTNRIKDNAQMAIIEWTEPKKAGQSTPKAKTTSKKTKPVAKSAGKTAKIVSKPKQRSRNAK